MCDDEPITEEEFTRGIKKGKSKAPRMNGVNYDGIRVLSTINGNPVLQLYNVIWNGDRLPTAWKQITHHPHPQTRKARNL